MADQSHDQCCAGNACSPNRRHFLALSLGVAAGTLLAGSRAEAAAALGVPEDRLIGVPVDKALPPGWSTALYRRGEPTSYEGDDLRWLGMPVGGGATGQLYLGGDGRLWNWDIFNRPAAGTTDVGYASPRQPASPVRHGFALRTRSGGRVQTRALDASGFDQVRFTGQYPMGTVRYRDADAAVEVTLEGFSPFVPLSVADSTLPATVLVYTLRNTSHRPVDATLLGYVENPACLDTRTQRGILLRSTAFGDGSLRGVQFSAAEQTEPADRPDVVFEDWERDTYDGWTVEGTAFGAGPVLVSAMPDYMKNGGPLNATGQRLVTSHDFRGADGDIGRADAPTGKLTSAPFTVARKSVRLSVGGGNHPGQTCVNLLVDDAVVATATGRNAEAMHSVYLDVSAYEGKSAVIEIVDAHSGGWGHVNVDRIVFTDVAPRPEIVFEDWERDTYEGWTVEGSAFGAGPVLVSEVPDYMKRFGDLGASGQRFVTSHDFRGSGGDSGRADAATGKLTSRPFTVERRYVNVAVGGGSHRGSTCVNLLVDGALVASVAGRDAEPVSVATMNLSAYQGRTAVIEIVDADTGGWGHVNVDRIVFSDVPTDTRPLDQVPDNGTLVLAALDNRAVTRPSLAEWDSLDEVFAAKAGPAEVDGSLAGQAGSVSVAVRLAPGQSRTVRFVLGWHFPVPDRVSLSFLRGSDSLRRHYATRFADARAVVEHVAHDLDRLEADTRTWVKTWYTDATLPHWFLERTLAPASTLATNTCYLFDDGRFYGWEGVYCCAGTCEHVWNYAQSIARLFPQLERDTRSRVDLGIGFHPDTGQIGNRAEADMGWATDGQCGTILRCYREHLTAPDDTYLRVNWPRLRRALEWIMEHDVGPDGTLDGPQPNTLDTTWYGQIAWITGMYVAALRAGAAMADEVGQPEFADRCRTLADSGSRHLSTELFNGEYFIQEIDPAHADAINSNRGCHIDQLFGQSLAGQLGLPRVVPAEQAVSALESLYRYNFTPDHAAYREGSVIPGGRWFAMDHEYGMLMTTWPHGGADTAAGSPASWAAMYFNEVWTGQEYQVAAHMLQEGLVEEGLTLTRAVHERYAAGKRNPYNEIECGDHYARAMASHGVYLAACGFEHHGPRGHIGFAPRISPDRFAAAFTSAEGWGLFRQERHGGHLTGTVEVRYGRLRVSNIALAVTRSPARVTVRLGNRRLPVRDWSCRDGRILVTLDAEVVVGRGDAIQVMLNG
ncbi:GH116 family glycosyl hydrolase [Micromonospora sp. CA-244673]|uniref:GH116 family glycosyl hydrolase n=1 Tax=Micromonospora sp. CA-244673 TaxID=3239958 RepID=UPI003D92EA30